MESVHVHVSEYMYMYVLYTGYDVNHYYYYYVRKLLFFAHSVAYYGSVITLVRHTYSSPALINYLN